MFGERDNEREMSMFSEELALSVFGRGFMVVGV